MKYLDYKVVFREVPDEIALAINISGCPVHCPGCHSSYLAGDIGEVLDESSLMTLIEASKGVTCVSFMGGDADPLNVKRLSDWVHANYPALKTCWYSGRGLDAAAPVLPSLDFVKVGPYVEEFGPLDSPSTNQRFYRIDNSGPTPALEDWTKRFLRKIV